LVSGSNRVSSNLNKYLRQPSAAAADDSATRDRLALIPRILESPPVIHVNGTENFRTHLSCYEFLARHVRAGSRTLETGAGVSTVLFAAWGCEHLSVVPDASQRERLLKYCAEMGVDTSLLSFDIRRSEVALPEFKPKSDLDLFFIDGNHGFPIPIIDWFYGARYLRSGGIVVLDDMQLPQVSLLPQWYLDRDPRWQHLESTIKWAAYRRDSQGSLGELQVKQTFIKPDVGKAQLARIRSALAVGARRLSGAKPGDRK
jgi:predicted O-methyltransferase YrrM